MALHLYCPTSRAILLFGFPSAQDGVFLFPSDQSKLPGLHLDVKPSVPINEQLIALVQSEVGGSISPTKVHIFQEFSELISQSKEEVPCTLYTGYTTEKRSVPLLNWFNLPTLIKRMGKDRSRLAYLKAWQVLTGVLGQHIKAVEMDDDELEKAIGKSKKNSIEE